MKTNILSTVIIVFLLTIFATQASAHRGYYRACRPYVRVYVPAPVVRVCPPVYYAPAPVAYIAPPPPPVYYRPNYRHGYYERRYERPYYRRCRY